MKKIFTGMFFLTNSVFSFSQNSERINEYITKFKDLAISEMKRTGVPASIKLAQGIHETQAGTSNLVQQSNNHFGIKCKFNWTGETVNHDDDAKGECFRKYKTADESYRDHSDFLKNSNRYAFLFLLDPSDYKGWANGLKKAGYATNPRYPQVLIKLIEEYQLQKYSLIALHNTDADSHDMFTQKFTPELSEKSPGYPEGVFSINATKVIFISCGTSFLAIAQQYNVPLYRIFEFNELSRSETSGKDQLIFLQRKKKTGVTEYHIVQPGEDLHSVAQSEAIRLESLLEYNNLKEDDIPAPGKKLYLKKNIEKTSRLAVIGTNKQVPETKIKTY